MERSGETENLREPNKETEDTPYFSQICIRYDGQASNNKYGEGIRFPLKSG